MKWLTEFLERLFGKRRIKPRQPIGVTNVKAVPLNGNYLGVDYKDGRPKMNGKDYDLVILDGFTGAFKDGGPYVGPPQPNTPDVPRVCKPVGLKDIPKAVLNG